MSDLRNAIRQLEEWKEDAVKQVEENIYFTTQRKYFKLLDIQMIKQLVLRHNSITKEQPPS